MSVPTFDAASFHPTTFEELALPLVDAVPVAEGEPVQVALPLAVAVALPLAVADDVPDADAHAVSVYAD